MLGRLRVVVRQLVPVLRHRQHPHGAERGNHRDIHDDLHGPRRVSDNKIQLKFRTKEFEGEYFHYTDDLFLIYKSGHLMKLMCQKREG